MLLLPDMFVNKLVLLYLDLWLTSMRIEFRIPLELSSSMNKTSSRDVTVKGIAHCMDALFYSIRDELRPSDAFEILCYFGISNL